MTVPVVKPEAGSNEPTKVRQHTRELATGLNNVIRQFNSLSAGNIVGLGALASLDGVDNANWSSGGADLALANGGTGASLADPNDDRMFFWDDSATSSAWLDVGTGLTISGSTIEVTGVGLLGTAQTWSAKQTFSAEVDLQDNLLTRPLIKDYGEVTNAKGSVSGAQTIDLTIGNSVTATATGAVTWTFSNPTASDDLCGFTLKLTNGGAGAQTWPVSVDWPSGTAPTLQASGTDLLCFLTWDGGTTWYGLHVGKAMA